MTPFADTPEGADFIASGDSRETSPEIMRAIAFIARNELEAQRIWDAPTPDEITAIAEIATGNGRDGEPEDYVWGAAGDRWSKTGWAALSHARKIELLAAHLSAVDVLNPKIDAHRFAIEMLEDDLGETGGFEVRGIYTRTGNPYAFTIDERG